jgi:antitoxin component YwqK of YwqJK toxin-antitoxin module
MIRMKRGIFFIWICLCLVFSAQAQTILNIMDSTGRKQNEWVTFYDKKNTKIKSEVYYVDGLRNGKAYFYTKAGRLKKITFYDNNRIILSKELYTSGEKLGQVKKINGIKVKPTASKLVYQVDSSTIKTSFSNLHDESGNKYGLWYDVVVASFFNVPLYREYYVIGSYKNGSREGNTKYYNYVTRELAYDVNYQNGVLNGVVSVYHKSGEISVTYQYVNGKRNGEYVAYFPNGNVRYKGTMKDDKLVGEYFEYDKTGKQVLYVKDAALTPPY